jgi:hypothetical protein
MNRLFVRVGIATSFLTLTLSLYLIHDIQNSKARFERKINSLHKDLLLTQENLTRTQELLKESHDDILRKLSIAESQKKNDITEPQSQTLSKSIKFCELPNIEHILRLVDKDIVRQIILHYEFAKRAAMTLRALFSAACRRMSRSNASPSACPLWASSFKCASTTSTRTCT